jgi:hypothetical protein
LVPLLRGLVDLRLSELELADLVPIRHGNIFGGHTLAVLRIVIHMTRLLSPNLVSYIRVRGKPGDHDLRHKPSVVWSKRPIIPHPRSGEDGLL